MPSAAPMLVPPATQFADRLRDSQPQRPVLQPAWRWLLLLTLVALLPRAVMAWRIEAVVADAPLYITSAKALASGDLSTTFTNGVGLNLFPFILMFLHRLGLPYETAGMAWSLLMSTLVVWPLFGWVRRQFDDRTAVAACLLYALHGRFIQWAPEVIRDPTFWFLAMLALYLAWRAVVEVKLWLFLATGLALTLAIHTRSEGWLLLLPMLGWAAYRWRCLQTSRWRLATGCGLALSVTPLALLLLNVTWLHDHPSWEWGRFNFLRMLVSASDRDPANKPIHGPRWDVLVLGRPELPRFERTIAAHLLAKAAVRPRQQLAGGYLAQPLAMLAQPQHALLATAERTRTIVLLRRFVVKIEKAFEPLFGLLFLCGWWSWRKNFWRWDQLMVGLMNGALVAAMWICNLRRQEIDSRYFLLLVLTATPYAGLGLMSVAYQLQQWACHRQWRTTWQWALPLSLVGVLAVVGAATSWTESSLLARREQANLGRWLRNQYGPDLLLAVPSLDGVVSYFAEAKPVYFLADEPETLSTTLRQYRPRAVLVVEKHYRSAQKPHLDALSRRASELGYTEVPNEDLPAGSRDSHLFVLPADQPRTARPALDSSDTSQRR